MISFVISWSCGMCDGISEMLAFNDSGYFGEEISDIDVMEDCDIESVPLLKGLIECKWPYLNRLTDKR